MMKKDIIKIGRRLNITVDEWSGLVAEFHQSKLTLPDFAKNKGINPYTFRYWAYDRARLKRNRDKAKIRQMAFVGHVFSHSPHEMHLLSKAECG